MDSDAFKHFDAETRKALQRTEAALEDLKDKKGATAAALRKSSRKLIKKLRGELKQLLEEYAKPKELDEPEASEAPKKSKAPKTKSKKKPRARAPVIRAPGTDVDKDPD